MGQKSSLSAAAFAADDCKDVPQGLKPSSAIAACGTAKPVPFVHQHNSKLVGIWTAADRQKQPDFALPSSLQSNQQVTSSKGKLIR
jgi:hypothetical protein